MILSKRTLSPTVQYPLVLNIDYIYIHSRITLKNLISTKVFSDGQCDFISRVRLAYLTGGESRAFIYGCMNIMAIRRR